MMKNAESVSCKAFQARLGARRKQLGVALIEAMIAMLIFSFGVLGLMGLESRAINYSVDAEDRNRAALFASEVASSMWASGLINVPASPNAFVTTAFAALSARVNDPSNGGLPNGVLTITPVAGTTNAADIQITWKPPSQTAAADSSVLTTRVTLP
jgi:type IV pilus assembly protein PilV